MRNKLLTSVLMFVFCLSFGANAGAQEAVITVEAFSPQELHDMGWTSPPSTGLKVVGRGEVVYLFADEAGGEDVTAFSWAIDSAPLGSIATLDSMSTQRTTFAPDSTGQYKITVSITTASGMSEAEVNLTVALYVGVGGVGGLGTDVAAGQCAICHSTNTNGWNMTRHSSKFTREISGQGSPGYNESCIECHTVGFQEGADNGGFADVKEELGWTFPDSLDPAVWDDMIANFPQLVHLSNIQCESCHGPGSLHKGDKSKIEISLDEAVCGRCHEEAPYHRKNTQWKSSGHANPSTDRSNIGSCAGCHSGYGFIARIDPDVDKGHTTTLGFNQVSCAVCHDPHSPRNPLQLRTVADITLNNDETLMFGGNGRQCMACHLSRRNAETYVQNYQNHFGPHHSNQTDMLAGTNAITFGKKIPSGSHKTSVTNLCVDCHMAATPGTNEPGHDRIGDHTFAMHDAVDGVDNVSACQPCHFIESFDEFESDFDYDGDGSIETMRGEIQGLLDDLGLLLPPFGETDVVVDTSVFPVETYTPLILQAAYNHAFVVDDGSMGMHNFAFAANLLVAARDTLLNATSVGPRPDHLAGIPEEFALHQNFPNPFNPTTTIKFDVPVRSHVKVIVFNSLGRSVETLVDEELEAKSYSQEFDASNLPSGLYFYQIVTSNFVSTKKMLLLK